LYQDAVHLCREKVDPSKWEKATFWVFDAPELASKTFEVREENG
jgi:hypothetical protein